MDPLIESCFKINMSKMEISPGSSLGSWDSVAGPKLGPIIYEQSDKQCLPSDTYYYLGALHNYAGPRICVQRCAALHDHNRSFLVAGLRTVFTGSL